MHELAVCQALLDELGAQAEMRGLARISRVTVRVGPLSGVVPDLLQQAYELARNGTIARSAELVIEPMAVRVYCDACEHESEALPNRLLCGRCGTWQTRLLSGDELVLNTIEFIDERPVH